MGTLINGIKEIFASASQNSPTNIPTCASDGTPNGNITIANLASVLGVPKDYGRVDDTSFNIDTLINTKHEFSILEFGNTNYIGGTKPSGITGRATLLTICPNVEGTQYLCDATDKLFVRKSDNGTIGQWNEVGINIPSFYKDYNNLSSLANALGGLMYIGYRDDANVIGTYFSTTGSTNNQHFPFDGSYWTLISIGDNIIKLCFQIAFTPGGDTYFRYYWNGWGSWRILS